jgi:hypothetical protein
MEGDEGAGTGAVKFDLHAKGKEESDEGGERGDGVETVFEKPHALL